MKNWMTVIILVLALGNLCCSGNDSSGKKMPRAVKGVLDLSGWDLERDGPVDLTGEWEFYQGHFYDSKDFSSPVPPVMTGHCWLPGTWNSCQSDGKALPGTGCATYRLTIINHEPDGIEAFRFRTMSTAFTFFVNGWPLFSAGNPGKSMAESIPSFHTHVSPVDLPDGRNEVILHVSNFHYRIGGPWRKITFGLERHLRRNKGRRNYSTLILFGGLFIMSLYFTGFWAIRRNEKSFLFFGLFCLLMSLRTMVTGEYLLVHLFPAIPFRLLITLEYLTIYLGLPVFCLFVSSLYRDIISALFLRAVLIISAVFTFFILVTPMRIFTCSVIPYEVITIIVCLYLFYVVLRGVHLRIEGSFLIMGGGLVVFAALINDILFSNFLVWTRNMLYGSMLFFILIQSFILSRRLSVSLDTSARLAGDLQDLSQNLEQKVLERTKELEQANEEIRNLSTMDPLTGCYNRRFMKDNLPRDIGRSLRYRKHLSIILCDIDNFKKVNDTHGHQAGDLVLAEFARYLKKSIRFNTDWIVRYGGEEFMIVLPETSIDNATYIAERMRVDVEGMKVPWHEGEIRTTSSFGVTGIDPGTEVGSVSMESLIGKADGLLYHAKRSGKNMVRSEKLVSDL